jgi:hypothetical protein
MTTHVISCPWNQERLFLEVARKLGKKVYVGAAKRSIMECLDLEPALAALLTANHLEANIHTVRPIYIR